MMWLQIVGVAVLGILIVLVRQWLVSQKNLAHMLLKQAEIKESNIKLEKMIASHSEELKAKREEVSQLKQDLNDKRKKSYELQEELKKIRNNLKELQNEAVKEPVYVEVAADPAEISKKIEQATLELKKQHETELARVKQEFESNEKHRENRFKQTLEQHSQERTQYQETVDELHRLRQKVENLKRIDKISKNQMELLEDKLKGLGRQYYDAVSELAALKGEVPPIPSLRSQKSQH